MKNLLSFKSFEGKSISGTICSSTTEEELTDYWKCDKCGGVFKTFNDNPTNCQFCRDSNIKQISDFDYMTDMKKKTKDDYNKELKNKEKREGKMVNLLALGELKRKREIRKNIN